MNPGTSLPLSGSRVVVVTGAASGIGLAAARLFASDGATVVINDIDADAANEAVKLITADGGSATPMPGDVSDEVFVTRSVASIVRKHGRIDVLVNNAGRCHIAPAEDYTQWGPMLAVNLNGPFYWAQQVARASMISRQRGAIVNVSSLSGLAAHPLDCAYIASKHGLVGLTKALALDWACYGIRVNCVCPGLTETPILKGIEDERFQSILDRIPMHRAATPDEQAHAIRFLASDEASYLTGVILNVDGGNMALKSLFPPRPQSTVKSPS